MMGVGDFDGDGKSDILWRHRTTGDLWTWPMHGATQLSQTHIGSADVGYKVVGIGDYDGDGKADILLRHQTSEGPK